MNDSPDVQAAVNDLDAALMLPEPDPDLLPDQPPQGYPLQLATAGQILSVILRMDRELEAVEEQARIAWQKWEALSSAKKSKRDQYKAMVLDWMRRTGTHKIQHPEFSAFIVQRKSQVIVENEAEAVKECELLGATNAVRVKKSLDKKEFDAVYYARPDLFQVSAREITPEPTLTIRRREQP